MSNNDPKTETKNLGLLSRLLGLLGLNHGDTSKGLKASKEPDIDRSIRYNERNQKVSGGAIAALFTYLASRDLSNFNIEFLVDFNFWGSDFRSTLQFYSQLISTSWDSITALVAGIVTVALLLFFVSTLIRGECLKSKARLIETTSSNNEVTQIRQEYEQTKAEAVQVRERAEKAESELAQLRDKADHDAAEIVELRERIKKAEANAANYLNKVKRLENEVARLRKIIKKVKSEEAYAVVERLKAETDLIKTKTEESHEAKLAYKTISNSFNKENGS